MKLIEASAPSALHDSSQRDSAPRCLPGTRQSQLADIMAWVLDELSDKPPIMWLSGGAGAGKSTIAQTIADSSATERRLAASFFCQRKHPLQSSADRVLPSVALQLALSNKRIRTFTEAAIIDHPLLLTDKTMDVQFNELIRRPLEEAGAPYTQVPFVVVLDGLDECGDHVAVQQLLATIRHHIGIVNTPLRFLITSRPEFPIEAFFRTIPDQHQHLHLKPSDSDIRTFILHRFSEIRTRHSDVFSPSASSWPSDRDIDLLVKKASGHFIYPSTVLDFVDYDGDHPRKSLDFILGRASLRSGRQSAYAHLDELYLTILRRVIVHEHHNLLHFLVIIDSGYLDICGAADVLEIELEEVQLMLRGLRSLVGPDGPYMVHQWHFLHASIMDFLMDPLRSQEFFIGEHTISMEHTILFSL
jgi:hypothetical protein